MPATARRPPGIPARWRLRARPGHRYIMRRPLCSGRHSLTTRNQPKPYTKQPKPKTMLSAPCANFTALATRQLMPAMLGALLTRRVFNASQLLGRHFSAQPELAEPLAEPASSLPPACTAAAAAAVSAAAAAPGGLLALAASHKGVFEMREYTLFPEGFKARGGMMHHWVWHAEVPAPTGTVCSTCQATAVPGTATGYHHPHPATPYLNLFCCRSTSK